MQEKHYPPPQTTSTFEIKTRNVGNSIKYKKSIPPPNHPHIWENQNKGIEDILDIDSHCPYLLFGGNISQKNLNGENSIKREMKWERIVFLKKKKLKPPPPVNLKNNSTPTFISFLMLEIAWNAKKTWNMEKKNPKFIFFNI